MKSLILDLTLSYHLGCGLVELLLNFDEVLE